MSVKNIFQCLISIKTWFKSYLFIITISCINFVYAGIPTIDPAALVQAIQNYQKQILQYQTQLRQYEDMIKNSKLPKDFVWSDINNVLAELKKKQSELDELKKLVGDVDSFSEFKTAEDYAKNGCLQPGNNKSCTKEEQEKLKQQRIQNKEISRKNTASAYALSIKAQEEIASDTKLLQQLQQKAQKATGANEIAQITNQITALQTKQLLRKNELLAEQIRNQAIKDKLAQEKSEETIAHHQKMYGNYNDIDDNSTSVNDW